MSPSDARDESSAGTPNWFRARSGSAIRATVGMLPFFEYKLEVSRWLQTRSMRNREDQLVTVLARSTPALPYADIATVIATYRRPDLLGAAVESALSQTVRDQVVVVVDDGGGELGALPEDPRLHVLALPENTGCAGVVRNVGIRLSQSRLLAFLDDDNTWEPHHLERALCAHRRGAEMTYSSLTRVDANGDLVDVFGEPFDRATMRDRSLVDTNALVIRRRPEVLFSRTPRHRDDFPGEDWELVWRLSRDTEPVHLPEATVRYVLHAGSNYSSWGDPPS